MFENKKILIIGLARSGYAAAKILVERGNTVVLNDSKEREKLEVGQVEELEKLGVELHLGDTPDILDNSFDYVIKNPGVPINHQYVTKAEQLGIEVINEVEMSYQLLPSDITLIGITGTNGKTTTTTITYEILHKKFGNRVHLAGNIGYPLCSILKDLKKDDIIVMEVSVQQSVNFKEFRPNISLMTNLSPAHIDFLGSYDNYKQTKARMFKNQLDSDVAIINIEDQEVVKTLENIKPTIKYFSSKKEINGSYLKDNAIYYYGEKVIDIDTIKIPGIHNLENCMSAIMICKEFNVDNAVINEVLNEFTGVEHRLEYVDTVNGIKFYNDTEATNIKSTQIALKSFTNPTIIILGGKERGQDFNELEPYMTNVKAIIGIGECRNRVLEFGNNIEIDTYIFEYLKDSFSKIKEISSSGDVVLLSPASASWDQYKECEVRGQEFKDLVHSLKD